MGAGGIHPAVGQSCASRGGGFERIGQLLSQYGDLSIFVGVSGGHFSGQPLLLLF
jgi:hypothetical protein